MKLAYDYDIKSSNIVALAYDQAAGVGYIQFGGNRRFGYKMPKTLFDQMKADKSVGGYFAKMVKGKCPVVWNGYACDNSPCQKDATLLGHPGNDPKVGLFRVCEGCSKTPRLSQITFTAIPETR